MPVCHAGAKAKAQGHNQINPELAVLEQQELELSMSTWLRGGIFFDNENRPRCFGGKLRFLRDGRPGREHLPFPAVYNLTKHWQRLPLRINGNLTHFGNGLWDTAQMLWHQWSTGTRSGKLESSKPPEFELKLLQQAVDRDWREKKIAVSACTFQYPTGFVSVVGSRLRRVRLHDYAYVQCEAKQTKAVQLNKAVTLVLPTKEAVTYVFATWFTDLEIDQKSGCRLVRPAPSADMLPFQLGALVDQVMVLHRCTHKCTRPSTVDHDPLHCSHRCRTLPCCPAHRQHDCKTESCKREAWQKTPVHYNPSGKHFVFDHDTGFVPDNPPLPLIDIDDIG